MKAINLNWQSFLNSPNHWSVTLRLSLLAALPIIAYFQDFAQVFNLAISNEEAQYILLIPFFVVFFLYRKRRAFSIQQKNTIPEDLTGVSLCITALLIYVWGAYSVYSLQLHLLSMPIFFGGMMLLLFGTDALKITIFPIVLLIFLSPLPLLFMNSFGGNLTNFLAQSVGTILKPFIPINVSYLPIATLSSVSTTGEQLTFTIGAACAGINFLISFLFLSLIFGYLAVGSYTRKVTLVVLSLILAFALNILRITLMVIIGRFYGMGLALDFFHLPGGIILISFGALLLLVVGSRMLKLPFLEKKTPTHCHDCNITDDICATCGRINRWSKAIVNWKKLAIILLFLAIATDLIALASAATYNTALLDENAAINVNLATGQFASFSSITGYQTNFLFRETQAEEVLKTTYAGHYLLTKNGENTDTLEAIFEIANIQSKFHTWEGCLNYQSIPIKIEKIEYTTFQNNNNVVILETITANASTTNQKIIVTYWFDSLYLRINGASQVYAVKVSLIKFVAQTSDKATLTTDIEAAKAQQISIANELENAWTKSKNSNTLAVDLYKNKDAFAIVTIALLTLSSTALVATSVIRKTNAKRAIANLSDSDKLLLEKITSKDRLQDKTLSASVLPENKIQEFKQKKIIHQKTLEKNSELYTKCAKY